MVDRDDKKQVDSQLLGHNSKVGFATNISSSLYTLLEQFPIGSPEYDTIQKRLKIGRVIQGEIIDSVKGLHVPPFRDHWTKYKRIKPDMTDDDKQKWEFNNKVLCQVRPAFFRFLYPHYMTRYNKEIRAYNFYSHCMFKKSFDDIMMSNDRTEAEEAAVQDYLKHTFFLDNNSLVNKISRYMRANLGLVGKYSSKTSRDSDYKLLIDKTLDIDVYKLSLMREYLGHYKSFKRGVWHNAEKSFENIGTFSDYLRKECFDKISSNEQELATYAVLCTYVDNVSLVEFAWNLFGNGVIKNIISNSDSTVKIPVFSEEGKNEYLWNKYSEKEYDIKELMNED